MKIKSDLLRDSRADYQKAGRKEKGDILDRFCRDFGCNRKYATWLLNRLQEAPRPRKSGRREALYGESAFRILQETWEAAGRPWSARLKALIPVWLPWVERRFKPDRQTRKDILAMSPRQMDRRLQPFRSGPGRPNPLFRHSAPASLSGGRSKGPGHIVMDLDVHLRNNMNEEFIYTLTAADSATGWQEKAAVMGRRRGELAEALKRLADSFPFRIRAVETVRNATFLRQGLEDYFREGKSRVRLKFPDGEGIPAPASVAENKDWVQAWRVLGWDPYGDREIIRLMNDLYANEFRRWADLFTPSVKLLKKKIRGESFRRVYDRPRTPFQRVLSGPGADQAKLAALKKAFRDEDPFAIPERARAKYDRIREVAARLTGGRGLFKFG